MFFFCIVVRSTGESCAEYVLRTRPSDQPTVRTKERIRGKLDGQLLNARGVCFTILRFFVGKNNVSSFMLP